MHLQPSSRQRELIALARRLACERFAPRADRHDRDASFPFDDYADLRAEGLLGLCVPERYGGLGADYETYCLVAEQVAQGYASTALTFNMHCLTMLMMGPICRCRRRCACATRSSGPPNSSRSWRTAPSMDSRTASRWSRARPMPGSVSAAGALAPPRARWMAAMWSTGGNFSSLWRAAPRITPPLRSGLGPSPGSSARSIS